MEPDDHRGPASGGFDLGTGGAGRGRGPRTGPGDLVGASLTHIGFTLLLAWRPWLVLLTAPAHSGLNLAAVRLGQISLPRAEGLVIGFGAFVFLLGLAVW
jgi:hypothetical protein